MRNNYWTPTYRSEYGITHKGLNLTKYPVL